jgi:hypothetical protein
MLVVKALTASDRCRGCLLLTDKELDDDEEGDDDDDDDDDDWAAVVATE